MEDNQHLDIYKDKSILFYNDGNVEQFEEGIQDAETKQRVKILKDAFDDHFYDNLLANVHNVDFDKLNPYTKGLIDALVSKLTSEVGRALIGLTFLQLAVKSIVPEQSVRLHKGSSRSGSFSWKKGITLRTLDKSYNTPFLREHDLLSINADGVMMTRSLAENYPYSQLYKADMRGPFKEWIAIVDNLESGKIEPEIALNYLLSLLINRSIKIETLGNNACKLVNSVQSIDFKACKDLLMDFFENTKYSARAFEVVIHSFMQAYIEMGYTELELVPLSQMRSANKKHGNVGDIEMKSDGAIIESWDAKYGKQYLYEELGELNEKLQNHPLVEVAGFIVNSGAIIKYEINEKINEVSMTNDATIKIFNFTDWVDFKLEGIDPEEQNVFAKHWLIATIESFARKRLDLAPIDEPCDGWLEDLLKTLKNKYNFNKEVDTNS